LIGDPATSGLLETHAEGARAALAATGGEAGAADWLGPGVACDIPFDGAAPEAAAAAVRRGLDKAPIDIAAQPLAGRRKGLLVADMESTIIGQEMIDELAEMASIGPGIAEITARSMAGELNFEDSLIERVALLAGLAVDALEAAAERMVLTPGARCLVATLRAHGTYCALVSGGFTCFSELVGEACGFDEQRANRLMIQDDRLTGRVEEPILGRDAKRLALEELAARRGLAPAETCALGDGANDLAMVAAAGLGAAYRGKAILRAQAGFLIDHTDLTALLYAQGYRRDEFLI
jgi:phosphoserine phosphatase